MSLNVYGYICCDVDKCRRKVKLPSWVDALKKADGWRAITGSTSAQVHICPIHNLEIEEWLNGAKL